LASPPRRHGHARAGRTTEASTQQSTDVTALKRQRAQRTFNRRPIRSAPGHAIGRVRDRCIDFRSTKLLPSSLRTARAAWSQRPRRKSSRNNCVHCARADRSEHGGACGVDLARNSGRNSPRGRVSPAPRRCSERNAARRSQHPARSPHSTPRVHSMQCAPPRPSDTTNPPSR